MNNIITNKLSNNKDVYPHHQFSKYIDHVGSCSNIYNSDKEYNKVENMLCDGNIMIEPRIQEYIKKKKFYKQNNLHTSVNIENEFQITKKDKAIIKKILNGKTNIYNNKKNDNEIKRKNRYFPSSKNGIRDDHRVPKLKNTKKIDRYDVSNHYADKRLDFDEDKSELFYNKKNNVEILDPMILSDTYASLGMKKKISQNKIENKRENKRENEIENRIFNNKLLDDGVNKILTRNKRYDNMQQRVSRNDNNMYKKFDEINYQNNKNIMPNISKSKNLNIINYKKISNLHNLPQDNLETELIRGMPSHTMKSYGYRNPEEHYFDYIEDDIQNANNVILPYPRGGVSTRLTNKNQIKN